MDPGTMMMLASTIGPMIAGGIGGHKGEFKSTYSKGARSALEDVLDQVRGMRGQGDISQNQNFQTGQNWLQSMFSDPNFFNQFQAPMQRQFEESTVPDLANRFASMGSGGSLGSTGFRNSLAREGSNLQTNLAALRGGMQSQAIPQLLGYSQQPFQNYLSLLGLGTTPTQNVYQPPSGGPLGNIGAGFAGGAAQGFGQQWGQNMAGQSPMTT